MKKTIAAESSRSHSPPPSEPCLARQYLSSQKGGTLISEAVTDLPTHERWMLDPDCYRPLECKRCHHGTVHMHDRKSRVLYGDPLGVVILIAIYICAECGATWRILPRFLARHLWRRWGVVAIHASAGVASLSWPKVAARTKRRWLRRLRSTAANLIQLLATSAQPVFEAMVGVCGQMATREELVAVFANAGHDGAFADLAALIHRLSPGVRLM